MPLQAATDYLDALTRQVWLSREVIDQYFQPTPLFDYLYARQEVKSGGKAWEQAINIGDPTNPVWIEGYQSFSYQPYNTEISAVVRPRRLVEGVTISDDELVAAMGGPENTLVDLVKTRMGLALKGVANRLEQAVHDGSDALLQTIGIRSAIDDGSYAPSYAMVNRTTVPQWNAVVDSTTTALSWTAFATAQVAATIGNDAQPRLGLTTRSLWVSFANTFRPPERVIIQGQSPTNTATGFQEILYINGIPIYHAPSTATGHLYLIDPDSFHLLVVRGRDGTFMPWQVGLNQEAYFTRVVWVGALFCVHPRSNAKFTALTT